MRQSRRVSASALLIEIKITFLLGLSISKHHKWILRQISNFICSSNQIVPNMEFLQYFMFIQEEVKRQEYTGPPGFLKVCFGLCVLCVLCAYTGEKGTLSGTLEHILYITIHKICSFNSTTLYWQKCTAKNNPLPILFYQNETESQRCTTNCVLQIKGRFTNLNQHQSKNLFC